MRRSKNSPTGGGAVASHDELQRTNILLGQQLAAVTHDVTT
jgi:hypothetical protein